MIGTTTALIVAAAASAGSKVASAAISGRAAGKAAKTQERSAQEANRFLRDMWGQSQELHRPYMQAGGQAANLLGQVMQPIGGQTPIGRPPAPIPQMPGTGPAQAVPRQPPMRQPPMAGASMPWLPPQSDPRGLMGRQPYWI